MSKRFYVLYSLKEFMIPRIYKTKATINKYIEENSKLEFKQFAREEDAQLFSKSIEAKLEKKFKIKMVDYLQKSHREIEEINEKSAGTKKQEPEKEEMGRQRQEKEGEEKGKPKDKEDRQQQRSIQNSENKIVSERVNEVAVKEEVTQPIIEEKQEGTMSVNNNQSQKLEAKRQEKGKTVERIEQMKTQQQVVVEETIETKKQIIVEEQTKQQQIMVKEEIKVQVIATIPNEEPKQQTLTNVQIKQETKEQTIVKEDIKQEIVQQQQQKPIVNIQEVKEEVIVISRQQQQPKDSIETTTTTSNLQVHHASPAIVPPLTTQHIPNIHHLFYPLSPKYLSFLYPKVIKYYNFPSICNLLRFHHLQNSLPKQQAKVSLTLNISLIFKQNPGLSLVILDIESPSLSKEANYLKTVVLGVKSKEEAKVLAMIQGLKYVSTFGKGFELTINSNFPSSNIQFQQRSLDWRVRQLVKQFLKEQQSFEKINYL